MRPDPENIAWARRAARFYRKRGWNPLPSRMEGRKRPMLPHAQFWDRPIPEWIWISERWATTNIQVMTGRPWNLAVVDLDGAAGAAWWKAIRAGKPMPRTWVSSRGPGSWHLWFTLPTGIAGFPKRDLWKGDGPHEGVELFCDHGLIVAPPSLHVVTGERYLWLPGYGPRDLARPADLPGWILDIPAVAEEARAAPLPLPALNLPARKLKSPTWHYSRADVDRAIAGRYADIAVGFGLRLATTRPSRSGWLYCYRIHDREDHEASASLSVTTGAYSENAGKPISFYELLHRLDPATFPTWHDAVNILGETYGASREKIAG